MSLWKVAWSIAIVFGLGEVYRWASRYMMISKMGSGALSYQPNRTEGKFLWEDKTVLIVVNPYGGRQLGRTIYESVIKPMFEQVHIKSDVLVTTRAGHARDYITSLDESSLSKYSGIVVVGGDGFLSEVINGLIGRVEQHEHIKEPTENDIQTVTSSVWYQKVQQVLHRYPVAIVPGGTSNGIASSLTSYQVVDAVKKLIEGKPHRVDLNRITFPITKQKPRWDCLLVSWGAVADHDILQEQTLRKLGWFRNILAPLLVIARGKKYRGVLKILPAPLNEEQIKTQVYMNPEELPTEPGSQWKVITGTNYVFSMVEGTTVVKNLAANFEAVNVPYGSYDAKLAPHVLPHEGAFDLLVVPKSSRIQCLQIFMNIENGEHMKHPQVHPYKVRELKIEPETSDGIISLSGEIVAETEIHMSSYQGLGSFVY